MKHPCIFFAEKGIIHLWLLIREFTSIIKHISVFFFQHKKFNTRAADVDDELKKKFFEAYCEYDKTKRSS